MPHEISRLLKSHEFVQQAISDYHSVLTDTHLDELLKERERLFDELVRYSSPHRQVTLVQLKFMLAGMADLVADKRKSKRMLKECLAVAQRLAGEAPISTLSANLPHELRLLDNLTDRVAVADRNYRYLYTNKANAAFHSKTPADILGKTAVMVVGKRRFEEITAPTFEKCFAGQSLTIPVTYLRGKRKVTYSLSCEPVRNDRGNVIGAICIGRDISSSTTRSGIVYPVPT